MAIIDSNTSGAAISTGQGEGYAQVLGGSSFDPVRFVEKVAAKQEARRQAEMDDELRIRDANSKVKPYIPKTNQYNKEELDKLHDDYLDVIVKAQMSGVDLNSSDGMKLLAQGQREMQNLVDAGDAVEKRVLEYSKMVADNPGKFKQEDLNKWGERLNGIKGATNQLKFIEDHPPFEIPSADINQLEVDIAKRVGDRMIEEGIDTVTSWDRGIVENIVNNHINNLPPDESLRYFQQGKKAGLWDSPESYRKKVTDNVMETGPYKKSQDEPRAASGGGFSIGGYTAPEKVNVEGRSRWSTGNNPDGINTSNGKLDEVSIAYNAKDIPPFEVELDTGGKKVRFAPSKWFKDKNDKWMVEGKSYGRTGEVKIDPNDKEQLFKLETDAEKNGGTVEQVGDKYVTFTPLKTEVVPYDLNEIQFKSHLDGFDLKKYADGWNKVNAKKGKVGPQPEGIGAPKLPDTDPN